MAAIDFPDSPAPDEEFLSPSGITYIWDAVDGKWRLQPAVAVKAPFQENLDTDAFKATAGTVNKHEVVHVTDWTTDGVPITVEQADASSGTLMPAGGIALEGFTDVAVGRVGLAGILKGFDTSAWAEGDRLWVDPASPGMFTNVRPVGAGEVAQDVGIVLEVGVSIGAISYSFFQTDKLNADDVFYDNATSGLVADDVQAAVDEIVAMPQGNRNMIINGAMQVDQRGSPFVSVTTGDYTIDRWVVSKNGASVINAGTVPNTGGSSEFISNLSTAPTTADAIPGATSFVMIGQLLEAFNVDRLGLGTAGAKTATLSFWARSTQTGIHCVSFRNNSGTRSYVAEYTINAINTDEFKVITLPMDITGTWNRGINSQAMGIQFMLMGGTNYQTTPGTWQAGNFLTTPSQVNLVETTGDSLQITGVQFEEGAFATPFEHRPYGDELARCQRYFERWGEESSALVGVGQILGTTQSFLNWKYAVTKRANPTITFSANADFRVRDNASGLVQPDTLVENVPTVDGTGILATFSSGTWVAATASTLQTINATGFIDVDAEL